MHNPDLANREGLQMKAVLKAVTLLIAVIATGAATVALVKEDMPDLAMPDAPWVSGAVLDGSVFYTTDQVIESGDIILDEFHFKDGTFQSAMCQIYCDFGWSDYKTWQDGETLHFYAVTRCPDAPHTVAFLGTVVDGKLSFAGTWTTRRWYWTHQISVIGEGTTTPTAAHLAES